MAVTKRPRGVWGSRFHFLIRFLGLTGAVAAGLAAVYALVYTLFGSWQAAIDTVLPVARGEITSDPIRIVVGMIVIGGALAVLALLVEALLMLRFLFSRRSAIGGSAFIQVALAIALLAGVNYLSFGPYHRRWDTTREKQFTLPADVQDQLRQLKGETTIVVYQQNKALGSLGGKPDHLANAAEHKVIEKVKDLVEQFRELGKGGADAPQFKVVVLDVNEEDFDEKKKQLTDNAPTLGAAIDAAPENSIFFWSKPSEDKPGKVQTLSYNEFFALDKTSSRESNNLVLLNQGVRPFASKILNVEEKRPVIGLAVVHEELSTTGTEETFTHAGLRKALTARGFEVRDIVLKRWNTRPPEADVLTPQDSRLEVLEKDIADYEADVKELEAVIKNRDELLATLKKATVDEINDKGLIRQPNGRPFPVTEKSLARLLMNFEKQIEGLKQDLAETQEALDESRKERDGLNVDAIAGSRRMTDLKAKFARELAECDLLIVPRLTQVNLRKEFVISPRIHRLNDAQTAAVQDFLKKGKPVLALFGPTNEPRPPADPRQPPPPPPEADDLENLLSDLGIRFGKETILFGKEGKLSGQHDDLGAGERTVKLPSLRFDGKTGTGRPLALRTDKDRSQNPLAQSMVITARSLGQDLEVPPTHPRPIYYDDTQGEVRVPVGLLSFAPDAAFPASLPWLSLRIAEEPRFEVRFEPEFIITDRDAWNADNPYPDRNDRLPTFKRPKDDDPSYGTLDERRRDAFPVGVAFETRTPLAWYGDSGSPTTVRVAAIGEGQLFAGRDLSLTPAKERLLLNTCNWLLGRDDRLPRADKPWSYPRVAMDEHERFIWSSVVPLALPVLFVYLGLVVLMVRRLR
jgi:hypothetical protein